VSSHAGTLPDLGPFAAAARVGASAIGGLVLNVPENQHLDRSPVVYWSEHHRQHDGRLTAEDQAIEDAAFAHIVGTPRTQHVLPSGAEWPAAPCFDSRQSLLSKALQPLVAS
jgi:hypothetical protein